MKTNKTIPITTHEGGRSTNISPANRLRRTLMTCMLWENNFYEDGVSIADRLTTLVPKIPFDELAKITIEARTEQNIRHAPLLICVIALKYFNGRKVGDLIAEVVQRADEPGEMISLYWKLNGAGKMLPRQLRSGLSRALQKFDEYQLQKYNSQNAEVKLRDVIFLTHARAKDDVMGSIFARLVNKEFIPFIQQEAYGLKENQIGLKTPNTWETRLSSGEDKCKVFTSLLTENKLGGLALLRNLRGMRESNVSDELISEALLKMKTDKILPFRFISARKHGSIAINKVLEEVMIKSLKELPKFSGRTVILVDISGSMFAQLSSKSDMQGIDAACSLAIHAKALCESSIIATFSSRLVIIQKPATGFALVQQLVDSQMNGSTELGSSYRELIKQKTEFDRLIIITDEQSSDHVQFNSKVPTYVINIAPYQQGVGYGQKNVVHINGWSEKTLSYIAELERTVM